MFLSIITERLYYADFRNAKTQAEWKANNKLDEWIFKPCSASTSDATRYCLYLTKTKSKVEQILVPKNSFDGSHDLWIHFTVKAESETVPSEIYITGYETADVSLFTTGISYLSSITAFFNHTEGLSYPSFIWNPELTHAFDVVINRDGNLSVFIDNKLSMQTKYGYICTLDKITLTAYNGQKELEFGNIIVDDDPSKRVEQVKEDLLAYRNLEREESVQSRIQLLSKRLLNYQYTSRTPQELKERHTPYDEVDPRTFVFPFLIGYKANNKEGYFAPGDEVDDFDEDEKVFFEL